LRGARAGLNAPVVTSISTAPRRSRPFAAPLLLSAEEAPTLFAELAAGGLLPIDGEPWSTFAFRGTASGSLVRLRVTKASRFSQSYWTTALEIEGVIRSRGTLSELCGTVTAARDRSGLVFGALLCLAFAVAIAWAGGPGLIAALVYVVVVGVLMALGQRTREEGGMSQAEQIARSLGAVQPLESHQPEPISPTGTADRWP
jgi:hypothetical protein